MANADTVVELTEIREEVEAELRRLSRTRLKRAFSDAREIVRELAVAGVITKKFAALVRRVLGRKDVNDAPDVLALLKIVPNMRA